jgi:hypothetical protein
LPEFGAKEPVEVQFGDSDTLKRLAVKPQHFKPVAVAIDDLISAGHLQFVLNHEVSIEEPRHYEFKQVKTAAGASDSIVNTSNPSRVRWMERGMPSVSLSEDASIRSIIISVNTSGRTNSQRFKPNFR